MRAILLAGAAALAIAGSLSIASAQPVYGNIPGATMQGNGLLNDHDSKGASRTATFISQGRSVAENGNEPSRHASFRILGASGAVP
jgi:hypothetical protein